MWTGGFTNFSRAEKKPIFNSGSEGNYYFLNKKTWYVIYAFYLSLSWRMKISKSFSPDQLFWLGEEWVTWTIGVVHYGLVINFVFTANHSLLNLTLIDPRLAQDKCRIAAQDTWEDEKSWHDADSPRIQWICTQSFCRQTQSQLHRAGRNRVYFSIKFELKLFYHVILYSIGMDLDLLTCWTLKSNFSKK